jgi:hypothetical protein
MHERGHPLPGRRFGKAKSAERGPSLGVCGGIRSDITPIAMRQIQREEIGLLLYATNDDQSFAKIRLCHLGSMLRMRLSGITCPGGWLKGTNISREPRFLLRT